MSVGKLLDTFHPAEYTVVPDMVVKEMFADVVYEDDEKSKGKLLSVVKYNGVPNATLASVADHVIMLPAEIVDGVWLTE